MKTGVAIASALATTVAFSSPALADRDDRWERYDRSERNDRREWREDRRERAEAYRDGYRAGQRAERQRDRWQEQRYGNGWYGNSRWNGNSGWNGGSRDGYPVYRSSSYRGSQPYWWGSNGQMHCRRQDGTTGLIVGALAGGTLGNMIAREGDKRLGSVIGGTLGAVLGNELAKGNVRCR